MAIEFSEDFEQILDDAARIDVQLNDLWMDIMDTDEYSKLVEFFCKDNYYDSWEGDYFPPEVITKNQKKILVGTDRIKLLRYAFVLGQLIGKAEYTLLHEDD